MPIMRVSLVIKMGGKHIVFWEMVEGVLGSFMISRPKLDCSHRLEFVYKRILS